MEQYTFNMGDKVICVDNDWHTNICNGMEYIVIKRYRSSSNELIEVCDLNKNNIHGSKLVKRFKLVDQSTKYPTLNKEYFKKETV